MAERGLGLGYVDEGRPAEKRARVYYPGCFENVPFWCSRTERQSLYAGAATDEKGV